MFCSPIKAPWVCMYKGDSLYVPAAVHMHTELISVFVVSTVMITYIHTKKWTNQIFFYCHCAWTLTLQVTQGVSCSELMNTLTCQWCALVTLSAGFVSVDGFSNKRLADPAPMLKTKVMQYEMLESKNGKHPGGQHLIFLLLHTTSLPMPGICGTLGKP